MHAFKKILSGLTLFVFISTLVAGFIPTVSAQTGNSSNTSGSVDWYSDSDVLHIDSQTKRCIVDFEFDPQNFIYYKSSASVNDAYDTNGNIKTSTNPNENWDKPVTKNNIIKLFKSIVYIFENHFQLKDTYKLQITNFKQSATLAINDYTKFSSEAQTLFTKFQETAGIQVDNQLGIQTSGTVIRYISDICDDRESTGYIQQIHDGVNPLFERDPTGNYVQYNDPVSEDPQGAPLYTKNGGNYVQDPKWHIPRTAGANTGSGDSFSETSGNGGKRQLSLIPSNPGVLSWFKISGGSQFKGDKIVKGLAFKILDWVLGFIAILAVVMITIAGIRYIAAGGNADAAKGATGTLKWSAAGLILVMLAESIVRIVFPTKGDVRNITGDTGLDTSQVFETAESGSSLIISILNWGLGFIAVLAIAMIVYAGFMLITARGSEEQQKNGTKVLTQSIIGLIIIMLAFAIVNIFIKGISSL